MRIPDRFISISNIFTDITAVSTNSFIAFSLITNPFVSPNILIVTKFQSVQHTNYLRISVITALLTAERKYRMMAAKILVVGAPGRINFVQWLLIFVCPHPSST